MKTTVTPLTMFVFAAPWAALGIWGSVAANLVFAFGGIILGLAFTVLGLVRLQKLRTHRSS